MDSAEFPDKTTLFRQEPSGVTYRIPALVYIHPAQTILAFAEKRSTSKDVDAEYLVMRRGLVANGSTQWQSMVPMTTAVLPGYRTMNPCPVYERESQTVFLFFTCVRLHYTEGHQILSGKNAARLCFITSKDNGTTWSQLTDLTRSVIGHDIVDWATFAVGPGHGIQLHCGRLIIPAYAYFIHRSCFSLPVPCFTKPHSLIFYSDDGGRSWHKGGVIQKLVTGECEVAELACSDGTCQLYCSARTGKRCRAEAISQDSGGDFRESYMCKALCEPPHGCQGSIVGFLPPDEYQEEENSIQQEEERCGKENFIRKSTLSWLIYSHPTSKKKRVDLGVYLNKSPLTHGGWTHPWIINKGPSAYSDLVTIEGYGGFGCLFECGIHNAYEQIAFRQFSMEELMCGLLRC
ncbi:sialidase-3-like [Ambystoma mexicanum]|uniref:sialidase-3-like n=1 Tax=Ambystoma mexicanum TaxID=8296 RepID=UPI0037E786EB